MVLDVSGAWWVREVGCRLEEGEDWDRFTEVDDVAKVLSREAEF